MRLFGLEITRARKAAAGGLMSLDSGRGWWPIIRESFTGAWQQNVTVTTSTVLTYSALYACVTLIASDIGKIRLRLVEQDTGGIWTEKDVPAFSPVLRRPNRYQNRIQFITQWIISKLIHGNTYVLKGRDARGVVNALYILDPCRVKPLVAPDGSVYYSLNRDNLSNVGEEITVPASEVIHDVMVPLYHPLVGVSPIYACGVAAVQGLNIQNNSARFFGNGSRPSGILTAPGAISQETADRLSEAWTTNYGGENYGKTAVLSDGLTYSPISVTPVDAQLIEQLKWTAETVCSAYHVPPYMIGVGPMPAYTNIEALNQQYYTQCLQGLIESVELCLDDGLGLGKSFGNAYGTEFDLDDLLRMDTATQTKTLSEGVLGGLMKPNEARRRMNLGKVAGGDEVYIQQQNFSLRALAKRDAQADPFGTAPKPAAQPALPAPADAADPAEANDNAAQDAAAAAKHLRGLVRRGPWRRAA